MDEAPAPDREKDIFVRQSTISSLQLCGQRVALKDHPGYLQAVSEPLVFGTLVHHLIAEDLSTGERQMGLLSNMPEWVEPILEEDHDWSIKKIPDLGNFFGEIAVAYRSWATRVLPKLPEPLSIEEEMLVYLGPGENSNKIFLQGTADAVFPKTLADWKTSGRQWKDSKAQFSLQATLYPALVKQNLGLDIRKFTFWVWSRRDGRWFKHTTSRTVREVEAGLQIAYTYGLQLDAGHHPATPLDENYFEYKRAWYCSTRFCPAWNVCDYKYLPDDVDERQKAERKW